MLLPVVESLFQAKFFGPCSVKQISEQNYLIEMPYKRKLTTIWHVNLFKPYHACDFSSEMSLSLGESTVCGNPTLLAGMENPCSSRVVAAIEEEGGVLGDEGTATLLKISDTLGSLSVGHLDETKHNQLLNII